MDQPQYFELNGRRLACRYQPGRGPLIVFLPGYMSDMRGTKAAALAEWAARSGRAYLRFDYSGCGESGGDFLDGTIGRWTEDTLAIVRHCADGTPVLLVGSSMGGWIGLRAGLALGDQLAAMVLIAPAPDFTQWGLALDNGDRTALAAQGYASRPSAYDPAGYRYSAALIADAPTHYLLGGPIAIEAPVRILHGQRDDAVPWRLSLDIAERLRSDDVQVHLVKDGDHRLSRPRDITQLIGVIEALTDVDA
jgi:pimeloyl-ACP methyl ester carboxylesterase